MICSAKKLVCLAPGKGKAMIVERLLCETVSRDCPATVMRHHPDATLLIDQDALLVYHHSVPLVNRHDDGCFS